MLWIMGAFLTYLFVFFLSSSYLSAQSTEQQEDLAVFLWTINEVA